MSVGLQQWFTLEIMHEYFDADLCTVFRLLPFLSTKKVMKNYSIYIQQVRNQFKGYINVADSKSIWEELSGEEDLFFQLINTDVYFDNYTDVTLPKKKGTLLYLTNSEIANRLDEEESIVPETNMSIGPLRFTVAVSPSDSKTVIIKDTQGNEIDKQYTKENQSIVFIDIQAFGSGVYEVWIDGNRTQIFFGTSESIADHCYGIVQIQMKAIIESLKENTKPILNISFNARATYWQYQVVVPADKKITIRDMVVEGVDMIPYSGPEKMTIGGKESKVFTSSKAIKLEKTTNQHPVLKIKYNNDFSDTVLELDIKMPAPRASTVIAKKQNNENLFYSPTIIYV